MPRHSGLLAVLHPPVDADYVAHFQLLASLNLELQREGPTAPRLLAKSRLEAAVGNYVASRAAAVDALAVTPEDPEAHYQCGVAAVLVALSDAGVVEWPLAEGPDVPLRTLAQEAHDHFVRAAVANGGDSEAQALVDCLGRLLLRCADDASLREALRRARRCTPGGARRARPVRQQDPS